MPLAKVIEILSLYVGSQDDGQAEGLFPEEEFRRIVTRERAKADRSAYCFALVVFDLADEKTNRRLRKPLIRQLKKRIRATDDAGWLRERQLGVLLHGAATAEAWLFTDNLLQALNTDGLTMDYHVYTYPPTNEGGDRRSLKAGQKEKTGETAGKKARVEPSSEIPALIARRLPFAKRGLDVVASLLGLIVLSPVFLVVALLIKAVSPGPAFYKQKRIGLAGKPFTFWKFRTMATDADCSCHQQYLAHLINGDTDGHTEGRPMLKLDCTDPNIIPFGKFLRKTCIDELPQLINVLRGEMSLIGPRPPIPYEVEEYKLWQKSRLDTVPGMTGLWQVSGKNQLTFEEMVRLDIRYARGLSLWRDLKIMLLTPFAIAMQLRGN